jgi:hypothetical protein
MLNDILHGQASLDQPKSADPYREQKPVEHASCVSCGQTYALMGNPNAQCPACVQAHGEAISRAAAEEEARSRKYNVIFGVVALVLGVGITVFTYRSGWGIWYIAVTPIIAGITALFRALVYD